MLKKKNYYLLHIPNLKSDNGNKFSGGQIAGIVIGVVLDIAVIVIKIMKKTP